MQPSAVLGLHIVIAGSQHSEGVVDAAIDFQAVASHSLYVVSLY
jgi:hypothetical protein